IIVEDTGPGLGPDEMQKLFTPFQRLSADAEEIEGTGLGLTIAKGLTEVMGGSIGAESEVGKGSRFWVEIPEAGPVPELVDLFHDEAGEASLAQTELTGAHTILYIEDNPSNLRLVERVLARPGIQLL